ncbi:hypothetical protein QQ008_22800 [Fulvivirgaceae bacterium BMA10]|uniref:Uncharacterized protein n=1 Tax=Splendidivirga corallicola TaxID=3051826 RepID=A0ABT8KVQ0_9BACT|nr:hypothetical protein [Fulvivirgaceae bacterium BMA10]
MYLNDQLIFEDLDLYREKLGLEKDTFQNSFIKKGNNTLKLVAKGRNENSPQANEPGFDYLKINPQ